MIRLQEVTRVYETGGQPFKALDAISLSIDADEFVAVTGESGCGKSTLMHLLGGIDTPSAGEIFVDRIPLHLADEKTLTHYRRETLGIVFQFFNLLPTLKAVENVMLPLLLQGASQAFARERALELLRLVDLEDRCDSFPHQLSGGEMQRTAIARALVHKPRLLLADEPTGNLDSRNAERVLAVLEKIASQRLATMVIVTHSEEVARAASRQIHLRDGKIVHERHR